MLLRAVTFCLGLLVPSLSGPALAQELSEGEASVLPRVIDTLCVDLVEALNGCETALLLTSEVEPDTADLIIISDRRAFDEQRVLAVVRDVAFNGPMFGMSPSLEGAANGALRLLEEQIGVGRSPWTQALTILHDGDGFIVAGRSFSTYDRAMGGGFGCNVDFRTGEWNILADRPDPETDQTIYEADESGRIAPQHIALADWTWTMALPQPCTDAAEAWWAAEPQ
ncbi:hypothetical protein [Hasllibacter sp. MH4015]|uniref:hypothetical protein n=1 Tax=Hasllibacter sp. MH4015 TaxID=2854029 RepID=UPI001CD4BB6D|nr:hypothetical protein [Hasllibacter sp. MH4015]